VSVHGKCGYFKWFLQGNNTHNIVNIEEDGKYLTFHVSNPKLEADVDDLMNN
jgi:hypothetical protein